jgi:hypothetical protein
VVRHSTIDKQVSAGILNRMQMSDYIH